MSELLEIGITVNAGFFAPAGLNLGAETPEEIALRSLQRFNAFLLPAQGCLCARKKYRSTQP